LPTILELYTLFAQGHTKLTATKGRADEKSDKANKGPEEDEGRVEELEEVKSEDK